MGTYAVAITRCETATIYVNADSSPEAEGVAMGSAEAEWEEDTVNWQVDDVTELTGEAADKVASQVIEVEA